MFSHFAVLMIYSLLLFLALLVAHAVLTRLEPGYFNIILGGIAVLLALFLDTEIKISPIGGIIAAGNSFLLPLLLAGFILIYGFNGPNQTRIVLFVCSGLILMAASISSAYLPLHGNISAATFPGNIFPSTRLTAALLLSLWLDLIVTGISWEALRQASFFHSARINFFIILPVVLILDALFYTSAAYAGSTVFPSKLAETLVFRLVFIPGWVPLLYLYLQRDNTSQLIPDQKRPIFSILLPPRGWHSQVSQIEQSLEKRNQQLEALRDIHLEIISELNLDELLNSIVAHAIDLISASSGGLAIHDQQTNCLHYLVYQGLKSLPEDTRIKPGEGVTGRVWDSGKALIVEDYALWQHHSEAWVPHVGHSGVIGVPIQWRNKPIGVLVLNHGTPGGFSENEREILELLTTQAAVAIQNARLLEAEKKARKQAEALWNTSRAIARSVDLEDILDQILHQLKSVMRFDTASFLILEEESPNLIVTIGFKDDLTTRVEAQHLLKDSQIINHMAETLEIVVTGNVKTLPGWRWVTGAFHVHSWLGVPLVFRERMIGALMIDSSEPDHFSDQDIQISQALAQHAAQAIQNARILQELQDYTEELEEHVQSRTNEIKQRVEEVEKLNKALINLLEDYQVSNQQLAQTSEKLVNINKELESFTYSVSHDLRAPLRAINSFSRMLMDNYHHELNEEAAHYLDRVMENAVHMDQLIEDLLSLSRLGRKAIQKKLLAPSEMVSEIIKDFQEIIDQRGVMIRIDPLPSCRADPRLLKQVFVNLISNALKFSKYQPEPVIHIGAFEKHHEQVYYIEDNGIGFDMKYSDQLFTSFQRLHRSEEYEGSGIGLAIVQRIISRHDGRVWAEAEPDQGATFYFSLPA